MMNREQELAIVRRAFAKQVMAAVGLTDARIEAAFATVERERYLGLGPWPILRSGGYIPTPDADPVCAISDTYSSNRSVEIPIAFLTGHLEISE